MQQHKGRRARNQNWSGISCSTSVGPRPRPRSCELPKRASGWPGILAQFVPCKAQTVRPPSHGAVCALTLLRSTVALPTRLKASLLLELQLEGSCSWKCEYTHPRHAHERNTRWLRSKKRLSVPLVASTRPVVRLRRAMPRDALHVTPRSARGGVHMRAQLQAHDRRNVAEERQAAANTPPAMTQPPKMAQARAGRSSSRPRSTVCAPLPRLVAMLTQPASPLRLSGL
jgi:hypothetical protein